MLCVGMGEMRWLGVLEVSVVESGFVRCRFCFPSLFSDCALPPGKFPKLCNRLALFSTGILDSRFLILPLDSHKGFLKF